MSKTHLEIHTNPLWEYTFDLLKGSKGGEITLHVNKVFSYYSHWKQLFSNSCIYAFTASKQHYVLSPQLVETFHFMYIIIMHDTVDWSMQVHIFLSQIFINFHFVEWKPRWGLHRHKLLLVTCMSLMHNILQMQTAMIPCLCSILNSSHRYLQYVFSDRWVDFGEIWYCFKLTSRKAASVINFYYTAL